MAKESAKESKDVKEKYRVKIQWTGGPKVGETIEGKINPVLLPNVVRVRDNEKTGSSDAEAQKIRAEADEYATAKRKEADEEADKILADARAEAEKLLEEATKPSAKK